MQIPILVINLDRSLDRLAAISERLAHLGLTFVRIPAIDGHTLGRQEQRLAYRKRLWRSHPTRSEIGCHLSHLRALQHIIDHKIPKAIILEDDAEFEPAFVSVAQEDFDPRVKLDVLKLEGILRARLAIKISGAHPNLAVVRNTYGSAAYLVTLEGAKRILKRLSPMISRYDDELFCYWRNGLRIYDYLPYPARQCGAPSTLDAVPVATARFLRKDFRFKRVALKKFDQLRQRLFDLHRFGLSSLRRRPMATLVSKGNA